MTPSTEPTPVSAAQLAANQQNSQKSTGPKTPDGKKRCRVNALRHGLTGQFHAFTHEDKAAFDTHCNSLLADLKPETYLEKTLAISMAELHWRLHRARALENNIFAIALSGPIGDTTHGDGPEVYAAACQARVWLQDGQNLALLTLYESRIRRNLEKDTKQLTELQAIRKAAYNEALEQAKLLVRYPDKDANPETTSVNGAPGSAPHLSPEMGGNLNTFSVNGSPGSAPHLSTEMGGNPDTFSVNSFEFSTPEITRLLRIDERLKQATFYAKPG